MKRRWLIRLAAVAVMIAMIWLWPQGAPPEWSAEEVEILRSLSLESLPALPEVPSNAVANNPQAAAFGKKLFFDPRLSANGGISCATCHQLERRFTDGLQKAQAIGTTDRHTPSIVAAAYSPWQFWDGRSDSLWSQALAPLEDPNEHALRREDIVEKVLADESYRETYEALFGDAPDELAESPVAMNTAFANIGKAIEAFERTILPMPSRFDDYVAAVLAGDSEQQQALFSDDERWGLRLFIAEANCTQCHNGPLFTNHEFHNTGIISFPGDEPDPARVRGVREVLVNEFNCRGPYSDDAQKKCDELTFARNGPELIGAFKTPSLRNLKDTEPFMHKGQLATLTDVLEHYNEAPDAIIGHNEAKPLGLSTRELRQLEAFLVTLEAPFTMLPDAE